MLHATPDCEAIVVAPAWPTEHWHAELAQLSSECVSYPAGSLVRVAADAPRRLESWPITVFHVPCRS